MTFEDKIQEFENRLKSLGLDPNSVMWSVKAARGIFDEPAPERAPSTDLGKQLFDIAASMNSVQAKISRGDL